MRTHLQLSVTGLCLLALLLAAWGAEKVPRSPTRGASLSPAVTSTATPWYNNIWPLDKRASFEEMEQRLAAAATEVALTPEHPGAGLEPTPASQPSPWSPVTKRVAGAGTIGEYGQAPTSPRAFSGQNYWYEDLTDRVIIVFAGAEGSGGNPSQGMLMIMAKSLDGLRTLERAQSYPTPSKAGVVHVTDAVGERLTLEAADGTRFYFDVATRQWVNP
jgi:hypothetical protein